MFGAFITVLALFIHIKITIMPIYRTGMVCSSQERL